MNERGFSLIQTIISMGMMGILMSAFASMMAAQARETHALTEKLGTLDLEKSLVAALADGAVCKQVLSGRAIPSGQQLPFNLGPVDALYASYDPIAGPGPVLAAPGRTLAPLAPSLTINQIYLQLTAFAGNTYTGNWVVSLQPTGGARTYKPITVSTTVTVSDTGQVIGCNTAANGVAQFYAGSCTTLMGGACKCGNGERFMHLEMMEYTNIDSWWGVCTVFNQGSSAVVGSCQGMAQATFSCWR